MAKEPDNVILKLLREMRRMLDDHDQPLRRIEGRVDEMHDSMVTALGLAAHANVRHDSVEERLSNLSERVEKLERRP